MDLRSLVNLMLNIIRVNLGLDSWKWTRKTTKKGEDYVKNSQRLKCNYKRTIIRLIADFTTARMEIRRQFNIIFKILRDFNC